MTFTAGFIFYVIIVLIALLPLTFLITVLLWPFWSWIEKTLNIESIGHSGPAEWCFLIVYMLCVGVAACLYKQLKILTSVSVLIIILLILLPLPHGGSLGVTLIHELSESVEGILQTPTEKKQKQFQSQPSRNSLKQHLAERFAGTLEFDRDFSRGHWQTGSVLGQKAWLDSNTGMIWGPGQNKFLQGWSQNDLQAAITHCRNVSPRGYWSLPTNAEFVLGVKNNMQDYITDLTGMWIAQSFALRGIDPMPTVVGFGYHSSNHLQKGSSAKLIRCIGRSDNAPHHGYSRDDISNEDVLKMLTR